jgi:preprotein translocase subunit Sec63
VFVYDWRVRFSVTCLDQSKSSRLGTATPSMRTAASISVIRVVVSYLATSPTLTWRPFRL